MKYFLFSLFTVCVWSACTKDDTDTFVTTKVNQSCSDAKKMTETDPLQAEKLATAALHLAEQNRYEKGRADALYVLGIANMYQGKHGIATDYYIKAIKLQKQAGDQQGLAKTYNALGVSYQYCKLYQNAEEALKKGQEIAEAIKDTETKAKISRALGVLYEEQGNYLEAADYYKTSLELFQEIQSSYTGHLYNDMAVVQEMYPNPDYKTILQLYQQTLEIRKKQNSQVGIGLALLNIGRMYVKLNELHKALEYMQQSKAYFKEDPANRVLALNGEAEIWLEMNEIQTAKSVLKEAESLFPLLQGTQKEKGIGVCQLGKTLYATSPVEFQKYKEKEATLENQLKEARQSITIDQLKEQSKAYQVETFFLKDAIDEVQKTKNTLMVALGIIVVLLLFCIYMLVRYRKLLKLFKEYVLGRDDVLGRFSPE